MRKRELLRQEKLAAEVIKLPFKTIEKYIEIQQCPYCKDGIEYKSLITHMVQMHNINAYDFKKQYGFNRTKSLDSKETSEKKRQTSIQKKKYLNLLNSNRHGDISNRYKDGGKRREAIERQKEISNQPEFKSRFKKVMAKVDRVKVAHSIPKQVRSKRSSHAAKVFWKDKTKQERSLFLKPIRDKRTPESEKVRASNAKRTMREKYWNDPEWLKMVGDRVRQSKPKHERSPLVEITCVICGRLSIVPAYRVKKTCGAKECKDKLQSLSHQGPQIKRDNLGRFLLG